MKVEEIFGGNTIKQIHIMIKQKWQSVFPSCWEDEGWIWMFYLVPQASYFSVYIVGRSLQSGGGGELSHLLTEIQRSKTRKGLYRWNPTLPFPLGCIYFEDHCWAEFVPMFFICSPRNVVTIEVTQSAPLSWALHCPIANLLSQKVSFSVCVGLGKTQSAVTFL
jgi:hypothetical protein